MNPIYILLVLILLLTSCIDKSKEETLPNIIWLMAEDISLDLGCYGMKGVKTPTLDNMAKNGWKFNNCYVTNPICSPSRSAMITGTHQRRLNAHHHRSNRKIMLSEDYKPFTYWLKKAGYTCILGNQGVRGKGRKIDVNFKHNALGKWDGKDNLGLFDKFDSFELEDTPFFMQVELNVTHRGDWWNKIREESEHPTNPDSVELPPYLADDPGIRLDWAKYLDQVSYMDTEVSMILQGLEDKGLLDNTIIIFIGDNGRSNIKGKGYLYEPGIHVPLIIKWPKGMKSAEIKNDLVSSTDITATILELAKIEIPEYMTGKSFLNSNYKREEVFASRDLWDEIEEKSQAIVTKKWKYILNDMPEVPYDANQAYLEFYRPALHIMRSLKAQNKLDEYQAVFFRNVKFKEELYNLQTDKYELFNLATDPKYKMVIESLRQKLELYDNKMQPVVNIYEPVYPIAVDLLKWVKKEKPKQYKLMLEGVEIGFSSLLKEYQNSDH